MRPISYSVPKHLIPVANKKLLRYNVEKVIEGGIDEIGLVVSPEMESAYREVLGESKWGASFTYIHQVEAKGLAHAVDCAEEFVGREDFLVYLGDNLLEAELTGMIEEFQSSGAAASILLAEVDDPERFGVAVLDGERIVNLVEKPDHPPSKLAIVGAYAFRSQIFSAIDDIEPSARGEYEITDAIQELINRGDYVTSSRLSGWWLDVGRPGDVLDANQVLLREDRGAILGELSKTELENEEEIFIAESAKLEDSRINGPVSIGKDVLVNNAVVGPDVSIEAGSVIGDALVENSIVMRESEISGGKLTDSIVGALSTVELGDKKMEIIAGNQTSILDQSN